MSGYIDRVAPVGGAPRSGERVANTNPATPTRQIKHLCAIKSGNRHRTIDQYQSTRSGSQNCDAPRQFSPNSALVPVRNNVAKIYFKPPCDKQPEIHVSRIAVAQCDVRKHSVVSRRGSDCDQHPFVSKCDMSNYLDRVAELDAQCEEAIAMTEGSRDLYVNSLRQLTKLWSNLHSIDRCIHAGKAAVNDSLAYLEEFDKKFKV